MNINNNIFLYTYNDYLYRNKETKIVQIFTFYFLLNYKIILNFRLKLKCEYTYICIYGIVFTYMIYFLGLFNSLNIARCKELKHVQILMDISILLQQQCSMKIQTYSVTGNLLQCFMFFFIDNRQTCTNLNVLMFVYLKVLFLCM